MPRHADQSLRPRTKHARSPASMSAQPATRPAPLHAAVIPGGPELRRLVARHQAPELRKSIWQFATTLALFVGGSALMYASLGISYWLTLVLALPTSGFLVRLFIIQHDCGHGAFFRSKRANDAVGTLCSLLTLTPYALWRRQHAGHHAIWNNLDRRDTGVDMYSTCLTAEEYGALSRWRRLGYRLIRNPVFSLILLPPLIFLLLYRVPFDTPASWRLERRSVYATNAAIAVVLIALVATLGAVPVLLVQFSVMAGAAIVGVWLFSVQHRFENAVWLRDGDWRAEAAALGGSSYLHLPRVLQWFTGNIGFHHIHHLNPRIPNYRLESCHAALPEPRAIPTLTLGSALGSYRYALWDEALGKMVSFRAAEAGLA